MLKMAKLAKLSDAEVVANYMTQLEHPLKTEIEILRGVIKNANPKLNERIKWNAPSYFYIEDIVTFAPLGRKQDEIMLVFHHPSVVAIKSEILTGDYKDRRLAIFKNNEDIQYYSREIIHILNEIISQIEKRS